MTQTYWKSYNRAFYPEIFEKTGAPSLVSEFGDWFSFDKTPRSVIIDRDHVKINDTSSLMKVMALPIVELCTMMRFGHFHSKKSVVKVQDLAIVIK